MRLVGGLLDGREVPDRDPMPPCVYPVSACDEGDMHFAAETYEGTKHTHHVHACVACRCGNVTEEERQAIVEGVEREQRRRTKAVELGHDIDPFTTYDWSAFPAEVQNA